MLPMSAACWQNCAQPWRSLKAISRALPPITADLTSLRKLHSKRDELLPVQYADDDSAWLLRSQLEQAARSFEPHWVAVARARREAGAGQSEPTRLIAAAYLAQEHEGGVDVLLELAESGGDDLIETAIAAATPSLDKSHSERLRKIVERVSNPEVKKELTEAIDQLDE